MIPATGRCFCFRLVRKFARPGYEKAPSYEEALKLISGETPALMASETLGSVFGRKYSFAASVTDYRVAGVTKQDSSAGTLAHHTACNFFNLLCG